MNHQIKKSLIAIIVGLFLSTTAFAHDFSIGGIYYYITDKTAKTVAVTYRGIYSSDYSNEYTGSVTIPSSVTYSGTTYSVTSIGASAFSYCRGLTSVTIPNSVTSIGSSAFEDCTGLTEVNISDLSAWCKIDFSSFDANPLYYAEKFKLNGSEIKDLVIPNDVTEIKNYAFYGCKGLTSITIPNSVTSIGASAFSYCRGLTSITIPNSVTSIGEDAFYNCTGLTSVTIPNSVTSIGEDAFYNCTGLTTITIPNSVTSISEHAFSGCTGLTSITIPNSVTEIGSYAFYNCTGLTTITIPNSVTSISEHAFSYCTGLTSITIPNSVTEIGSYAFYNCTGLTEVTIGNSVTSIGNYAFSYCTGLTSIIIPNSVTSIGNSAFYGTAWYNNLADGVIYINNVLYKYKGSMLNGTSISVKDGTVSISPYAFRDCTGLTSVTIGNSVTSIGYGAFSGCTGLTSIVVEEGNPKYDSRDNCNAIIETSTNTLILGCKNSTIPNSVTEIGEDAFSGCTGLTTITIPNSVTSIGNSAFYGCSNLETVINLSNLIFSKGSSGYGYIAYYACRVINDPNVSMVEDFVFSKVDNVNILGAYLGNATELILPTDFNGENYIIGDDAFRDCSGLTSVTIGNSVTSIGDYAFYNCTGLTEVTIPNSVTSIGNQAFYDCSGLTEVNYNAENCTSMGSLNYPVFGGCSNLKIVNIGSSVKSIPSYAFSGCTGLTEVTISNSVTSIGDSAFEGCTGLSSVNYNAENCTSMGSSSYPVFSGCSNLKTLNIGNEVKTIPSYAFCNCDGLTSITIPNSVTAIGNDAFYGCSNLIEFNNVISPTSVKVNLNTQCSSNLVPCIAINNKYYTNNTLVESLDPEYNYNYDLGLQFKDNFIFIGSSSFLTGELELTTQAAKATSSSSVRLIATTNCDATAGTGFEWRRYDAPAEMPSNKVSCPIVDGMLVGTLRGLRDDAYYKYRPFYTSASGNSYYGEWIAFFTGDANVYFEPEVQTYSDYAITDNSVVVKGYVLEGTDEITAQGFEYWKTGSTILPSSTENRMTVMASGIKMSATLANLEYNSTYKYRAFVTTAKGTTYGDEVEFETGNDPVGVENILIDKSATEVFEIARYDIHGRLLSKPSRGINIIIYSDGSTRKEIVKE